MVMAGSVERVRAKIDGYRAAGLGGVHLLPSPPGGYYPLYEGHFPVESLSQLPEFDFPGADRELREHHRATGEVARNRRTPPQDRREGLPPPQRRREHLLAVAGVGRVEVDAGADDLVDAVEQLPASSATPAAGSWLSSCSIVRGPMIADVTAGWLTTKAIASSISEMPASSASFAERLDRFELALVLGQRHVEPRHQPLPGRGRRAWRPRVQRPESQPPASGL